MSQNQDHVLDEIFDRFLSRDGIFKNRDVLRHDYIPDRLPHRDEEIRKVANILAPSLKGSKISNAFIYGKTGTGKTAVARYVLNHLEGKAKVIGSPLSVCYVNCRLAGTNYRVLADLCRSVGLDVPFTGLAVTELLDRFKDRLNSSIMIELVVLDEIDALVKRQEDDSILYELTRVNESLSESWVGLVGISNDLHFKEFLDARVLSCLSEEEVVFRPYLADELYDILAERAAEAFKPGVLDESSLRLCAALAAKEHGDARRALDLLRVAGEIAEREGSTMVSESHVRVALQKIENDRFIEALKFLPLHQKIIVLSAFSLRNVNEEGLITGDLYQTYLDMCSEVEVEPLTQRRISGLINELDAMGLLNARVVSFGRHGRTKKIKIGIPDNAVIEVFSDDPIVGRLLNHVHKGASGRKSGRNRRWQVQEAYGRDG
ncbi:MAG: Cdc6/Cdc18 family protein [Candidatus Bathyarchaeia archaeon]